MIILIIILTIFIGFLIISPYPQIEIKRLLSFTKTHKNNFVSLPVKSQKIAIITAEDRNDDYIKMHDKSITEYCNLHGYDYIRMDNCKNVSTYWCKIHKVKSILDSSNYDYVIWLDSDTIIVNNKIPIEYYLSKYGYPDIIFGKNSVPLDFGRYSINAGIFAIKNSEIGKKFINESIKNINSLPKCLINNKEQGFWVGICYEEGIMNILVKDPEFKNNVFIDMDNTFILNYLDIFHKIDDNLLFLHLPGYPNNKRKEIFKKYCNKSNEPL